MLRIVAKTLSAVIAAAVIAGAIVVLPGASDRVSANSPLNAGKGDRLDIRAAPADCSEHAWPYYEAGCVKDRRETMSRARPARIVSTDRIR